MKFDMLLWYSVYLFTELHANERDFTEKRVTNNDDVISNNEIKMKTHLSHEWALSWWTWDETDTKWISQKEINRSVFVMLRTGALNPKIWAESDSVSPAAASEHIGLQRPEISIREKETKQAIKRNMTSFGTLPLISDGAALLQSYWLLSVTWPRWLIVDHVTCCYINRRVQVLEADSYSYC